MIKLMQKLRDVEKIMLSPDVSKILKLEEILKLGDERERLIECLWRCKPCQCLWI